MASSSGRTETLRRSAIVAFLAWTLASACAHPPPPPPAPVVVAPRTIIVLLPDESGTTGAIAVSTSGGTQEVDRPGVTVGVRTAAEAPAAPVAMPDDEVQRLFGAALAARPAAPVRFLFYFDEGSEELVPASRALLPGVQRTVSERRAVDVSVVGHTDTVGDKRSNYALGLRRAEKVAAILRNFGVDSKMLEITSFGEEDLLVKTPDNVREPANRRVEVTIR